jgi:hypothetical protein
MIGLTMHTQVFVANWLALPRALRLRAESHIHWSGYDKPLLSELAVDLGMRSSFAIPPRNEFRSLCSSLSDQHSFGFSSIVDFIHSMHFTSVVVASFVTFLQCW